MPRDDKYDLRPFLDRLYGITKKELAIKPGKKDEIIKKQTVLREAFYKLLGLELFGGLGGKVASVRENFTVCDGYTREKLSLTLADGFVAPCYILRPQDAGDKTPVMLCLYGHGRGACDVLEIEDPCGQPQGGDYMDSFPIKLCKRGFVTVVPEIAGFGESYIGNANSRDLGRCAPISGDLLILGSCCTGLRVFQSQRVLDFIATLDYVDFEKLGCIGISGGGTTTFNLRAVDDRVKSAVISGYANLYKDSIFSINHCVDNYIPSILEKAEMSDILALVAPRPMMLSSGSTDRIFPQTVTRAVAKELSEIYKCLGAENSLETDFFEGGHKISGEVLYEFCERTVK